MIGVAKPPILSRFPTKTTKGWTNTMNTKLLAKNHKTEKNLSVRLVE